MQSIICTAPATLPQQLDHEWYGNPVSPAIEYSFTTDGEHLVFRAAQAAEVCPHPEGKPGEFREELWKYDTAEFFIAAESGSPYMEVNVAPNGAWWACAFSAPRVRDAAAGVPVAVRTTGEVTPEGWRCSASLPLAYLRSMDIDIFSCRLAATCILNSPDYLFYTTSDDQSGEPDFHRPQSWAKARFV